MRPCRSMILLWKTSGSDHAPSVIAFADLESCTCHASSWTEVSSGFGRSGPLPRPAFTAADQRLHGPVIGAWRPRAATPLSQSDQHGGSGRRDLKIPGTYPGSDHHTSR